jgi:transcriptional regulator with XRE-family HTH domain
MYSTADRIRFLREGKERTQWNAAQKFGIESNSWSQYENGTRRPKMDIMIAIARNYKVSMDYLLCITDIKYDPSDKGFNELAAIYCAQSEEKKAALISLVKQNFHIAKKGEK